MRKVRQQFERPAEHVPFRLVERPLPLEDQALSEHAPHRLVGKLGRRAIKTSQLLATVGESIGTGAAAVSGGLASTFGTAWTNIIHGITDVAGHHGHDRIASGELAPERRHAIQKLTFRAIQASGLFAIADGTATLRPMGADIMEGTGRMTGIRPLEEAGMFVNRGLEKISNIPYVSDILPLHSFEEKTASIWQMGGSLGQYAAAALGLAIITRGANKKHGSVEAMYEKAKVDEDTAHDRDRHKHIIFDRKLSRLGAAVVGMSWLTPKITRLLPDYLADILPAIQTPVNALAAGAMVWVGTDVVREFNPTKERLAQGHVCASSDHSHSHSSDCSHEAHEYIPHHHHHEPITASEHQISHADRPWWKTRSAKAVHVEQRSSRFKRVVAAGLAGAALMGLVSDGPLGKEVVREKPATTTQISPDGEVERSHSVESEQVAYDSLWRMSEDQIQKVTGHLATPDMTNVVTKLNSHLNRDVIADPGYIQLGEMVRGLSDQAVEMIVDGTKYNATLTYQVDKLNSKTTDQEALADTATLNSILKYARQTTR